MAEQAEQHDFEKAREGLRKALAERKSAESTLKRLKEELKAEMEPWQARLDEIKAAETTYRDTLVLFALQNAQSAGKKTVAGVQLRETVQIAIDPEQEAALCRVLIDQEIDGRPLVNASISKTAMLQWAKLQIRLGNPLPPGVELVAGYSVALVDSD